MLSPGYMKENQVIIQGLSQGSEARRLKSVQRTVDSRGRHQCTVSETEEEPDVLFFLLQISHALRILLFFVPWKFILVENSSDLRSSVEEDSESILIAVVLLKEGRRL